MPIIQVLDTLTINQIAAGEVIERPSAVVKELAENAVDAGANAITIEIKEGGISLIRITDNGKGIEKEDIRPAFLRHATSKIRSAKDLSSISSLGFRGEALSSIAAVAQVELVTKTAEEFTGYRYLIEGGEEKGVHIPEPIGCPEGTTFVVRNLFYNTPARKKFLKTPANEAGHIQEVVEHMAASHPEVAIKFIVNGQPRLQTPGNGNLKDVLYYLYGRNIAQNLLAVSGDYAGMSLSGYIGNPSVTKGNRNLENYYLNGRFIRNSVISRAIEDAYKPYLMQHRYPFTSLQLQVPPDFIDVNVHPSKLEVRFRNTEALYQLLYHAVSEGLRNKELIPEVVPGKTERKKTETPKVVPRPEPFEIKRTEALIPKLASAPKSLVEIPENRKTDPGILMESPNYSVNSSPRPDSDFSAGQQVFRSDSGFSIGQQLTEQKFLSQAARPKHRLIGQLFATYWLFEYEDQFYMLDQHAAHEKVLYEKTMKRLSERRMESQILMPPIVLTLSAREEVALEELKDSLTQAGFEIEPFGGQEYALSAVPVDLFGLAEADLLTSILDDYLEKERTQTPEVILERVASMSCKAAVKGKQVLSEEEAIALIEELMELEQPYHCPHGRPTMISMSKYEIEKKFKRVIGS